MLRLTTTATTGNFIENIETELGTIAFNFLRKTNSLNDKYFILALDKNLKAHWFSMTGHESRWVIVNRVPKWIGAVEAQLSEAIYAHNPAN